MSKRPETTTENINTTNQSGGTSKPAYLAAAARLSTSRPLGAKRTDNLIIATDNDSLAQAASDNTAVAGGCVIHYLPTYGVSTDSTSALNRSAFYEFNAIRSQISGNRPYGPVDTMIYRQCVDSMRELYTKMKRAYTILSTYNALNLYRPRAIFRAMGLDFDDWSTNAANLYQWLVNNANALEPFPTVPIGSISDRHEAFNAYIYTDGETPSSQAYIFNQIAFYSYEVVDEVKGITLRNPGRTVASHIQLWNDMYTALQQSSDVYVIAADIRRAFPDRYKTTLTPPAPNDAVQYVKFDPILTCIMNLNTIALKGTGGQDIVVPDYYEAFRIYDAGNNELGCNPEGVVTMVTDTPSFIVGGAFDHLNFVQNDPSADDIVNAARMHLNWWSQLDWTSDGFDITVKHEFKVKSMSTEVCVSASTFAFDAQGTTVVTPIGSVIYTDPISTMYSGAIKHLLNLIGDWSVCDWMMPVRVILGQYADPTQDSIAITLEDVQNYVPLDDSVLQTIHDAILYAEFGLPG